MDKQNLIIFKLNSFYNIMKELEENLNFKIFKASNEKILNMVKGDLKNYLIITSKKINYINNQFTIYTNTHPQHKIPQLYHISIK